MAEQWIINSEQSLKAFLRHAESLYNEHKYITYSAPRIGKDRSLSQNALFHVFCTEYAAYKTNVHAKGVSAGLLDGMKRIVKKNYTAAHPESYSWMVYELVDPFTGNKKKDYTSSSKWKRGEMFLVLEYLQMVAAQDGLILEGKGEFAKLQRESNGV